MRFDFGGILPPRRIWLMVILERERAGWMGRVMDWMGRRGRERGWRRIDGRSSGRGISISKCQEARRRFTDCNGIFGIFSKG